jgi:NTP pyrophosphatase (non-canonical NTP hydrolase)
MNEAKFALSDLQQEVHQNAIDHGWWDEDRTFGELIALVHSEASEALEEYRNGIAPDMTYYKCNQKEGCKLGYGCEDCRHGKPEGIPSELADIVIRILDLCGRYGINLERAIREKHRYNKTRPYKHGGKVI